MIRSFVRRAVVVVVLAALALLVRYVYSTQFTETVQEWRP